MPRGLAVIAVGIASLAGAAAFDLELVRGLESSAVFFGVPGTHPGFETIRLDILPSNTLCNSSRIQFFGHPLAAHTERDDGAPSSTPAEIGEPMLNHWVTRCVDSEGGFMEAHLEGATGDGHPWSVTLALGRTRVKGCIASGALPWTFFEKTGGDMDSILTIDPIADLLSTEDMMEDRLIWIPAQSSLPEHNSAEDRTFPNTDSFEDQTQLEKKKKQRKANCKGWRCLAQGVMDRVQSKASRIYHPRPAPNAQGFISTLTSAELPKKMMRPLTPTGTHGAAPTPSMARFVKPGPEQDLLMTLSIAAVSFTIFSFLGIAVLGARRYVSSDIQLLPYHRESREERLARVANRRHAFKAFFQKLFCGLFGYAEKETWTPQGRDLRDDTANNNASREETTLEDDIAGFRAVADMVESLVTVEEGRGPSLDHGSMSWNEDDAPPPSYESDSAEGSMVADGFRYTPGGSGYPQSTPQTSSDRLGYEAK